MLVRRLLLEGGASTPSVVHTVTAMGTQFGPAYIRLHYLPAIAASLDIHAKRPTARTATIVPNVLLLVQKLVLQLSPVAVTDVLDNVLARPLLAFLMPLPAQPKLDEAARSAVCRGALEVLRYITHSVPRALFEKKVIFDTMSAAHGASGPRRRGAERWSGTGRRHRHDASCRCCRSCRPTLSSSTTCTRRRQRRRPQHQRTTLPPFSSPKSLPKNR